MAERGIVTHQGKMAVIQQPLAQLPMAEKLEQPKPRAAMEALEEPDMTAAAVASMVLMVAVVDMTNGLVAKGKVLLRESSPKLPENCIQPEDLSTNRQKFLQIPAMEEIMEAPKQTDIWVLLASL